MDEAYAVRDQLESPSTSYAPGGTPLDLGGSDFQLLNRVRLRVPFFLPAAAATGCSLCVCTPSSLEHMINILTGSAERTLRAGAAGLQGRPGGPCEGRTVSPGGVAQQHTPAAWAPQSHVEHFHSMQKRFCGRSTAAAGRRACRRRGRPRARAGACSAGAGARSRALPAQGLPADTACEDPGACR